MPPIPNAVLEGTVKSIDPWVITTAAGHVSITVNAQTRIDTSIKVGDKVHVLGTADANGHITAMTIYKIDLRPVQPPTGEGVHLHCLHFSSARYTAPIPPSPSLPSTS